MVKHASNYRVQLAFETSIRDFKANLKDDDLYKELFQTTTIDEVYHLTDKLQEEQMKTGNLRHLAKIGPFLERLRGYTGVIEIFIQAKPDILALIWGPIKLLIQWTSTLKKSLDQLIKTIGDIGDVLPEFEEIMKIFGHNEQINDVLALFFQDILDIYIIALKFFSLPRWKIVFEAMWPKQRDKIQVVSSHIERHTFLLRNETRLEHIREEQQARLRALDHFEKSERSYRKQEYGAIKETISPKMYDDELYRIRNQICAGTEKWLLRDPVFGKWLKTTEKTSKVVWLQGIPGAGKTYLSGTVVEQALAQGRALYAFLSYKHSSSITAISILHSLLFQLTEDDEDLQALFSQSATKELKRDLKKTIELLTTILSIAGKVFIVVDGVDEIEELERRILLQHLLQLSNNCEETKFLVSSRIEDDIHSLLQEEALGIRVDIQNAGSIQAFVNHQVGEWFRAREFIPEAQAEILGFLAPLSSKAKGMFLYAKIILSSIEHLDDLAGIRDELQILPENLDHAYARILERINNHKPPSLKEKARKLLGWVGSSPTPLTVQEIEQALLVRGNDPNGDLKVIASLNPVRLCGPILEIVDDYVQLVHFTAKEYIFNPTIANHISLSDATLSLVTCCIQYLCQRHHDIELSEEELRENLLAGKYRLHAYSATMWLELLMQYMRFVSLETPSKNLIDLLGTFVEQRSNSNFIENAAPTKQNGLQAWLESGHSDISKMLHNATTFDKVISEGELDKRKGETWSSLDPLTINAISIRISEEFDSLLCHSQPHHNEYCHCVLFRRNYGQQPFKCSFLGCSFTRHGFFSESARNSHRKHHELPWKCNRAECQYSQGFLSRNMRDKHWQQCHRESQGTARIPQNLDDDEIQPLLFDLVRWDTIDLINPLTWRVKNLSWSAQRELLFSAVTFSSPAMVDLIKLALNESFRGRVSSFELTRKAIEGNNLETFKHVLQVSWNPHLILYDILKTGFTECLSDWELYMDTSCDNSCQQKHKKWTGMFVHYTSGDILATVAKNHANEDYILSLWKKIELNKHSTKDQLGSVLLTVAGTSCSIKLARYLLDAGVTVNFRHGEKYLTPLHYAAKHDTPAAAQLMEFLLGSGADSEAFSETTRRSCTKRRYIRDEKGAKGVSKWLGLSWDELVEKKKKEIEEVLLKELIDEVEKN